jgi:hypothetical protein
MIRVFADTEFTGFEIATQQIISLGLVTEDGQHEFYAENTSHYPEFRSAFVQAHIIPLLEGGKLAMTYEMVAYHLHCWIESLPDSYIEIIVDYNGDWHLIEPLLKIHSSSKTVSCMMYNVAFLQALYEHGVHTEAKIDQAYRELLYSDDSYYNTDPRQHHALVDAKSNRHNWICGIKAGL